MKVETVFALLGVLMLASAGIAIATGSSRFMISSHLWAFLHQPLLYIACLFGGTNDGGSPVKMMKEPMKFGWLLFMEIVLGVLIVHEFGTYLFPRWIGV